MLYRQPISNYWNIFGVASLLKMFWLVFIVLKAAWHLLSLCINNLLTFIPLELMKSGQKPDFQKFIFANWFNFAVILLGRQKLFSQRQERGKCHAGGRKSKAKYIFPKLETQKLFSIKGIVWHFGKHAFSLSDWMLHEKIDTTLISVQSTARLKMGQTALKCWMICFLLMKTFVTVYKHFMKGALLERLTTLSRWVKMLFLGDNFIS